MSLGRCPLMVLCGVARGATSVDSVTDDRRPREGHYRRRESIEPPSCTNDPSKGAR